MKSTSLHFLIIALLFGTVTIKAQEYIYPGAGGKTGITLKDQNIGGLNITFSMEMFELTDKLAEGEMLKSINVSGNFLPNNEGAPDLPGFSRFVAIPEGAEVRMIVKNYKTETLKNVKIAPAPKIPLDTDNEPLKYIKNKKIYNTDAYYPTEPFMLSEMTEIRGVDAVILGITPFQYNPVAKELIVYYDIEIEIEFKGGNAKFGDNRLRSRWFDPILEDALINYESLPEIDYAEKTKNRSGKETGYEYLIVIPNNTSWEPYAEQIKDWRVKQGISTGIVTLNEIGGTSAAALESYFNNAYNTWDVPPVAVLLMADYGTNASNSIISPIYDNYCVSDNIFADVNNNSMPDIIFARMTAQNTTHLQTMVSKMLDYEASPPTDYSFYNKPITALGWQTERWFQICSETVGGYWKEEKNKNPVRINAIYDGNPGTIWSSAPNTSTVINYFGPNGQGYIPATPAELGGWSGGEADDVIDAINDGAFAMQHRDHGYEYGWGEPSFSNTNINSLANNQDNELIFVFSINCLTGKYNISGECFTEKFHRHTYSGENAGALGLIAASEVSYSFVNDTYVWGMFDNMNPDFMPDYGPYVEERGFLPAFGNAAGKYFLQQSNWPYNTNNKQVTYNLFHHHGGAFLTVYTEVPQNLTVNHSSVLQANATTFTVNADAGSLIALTANGNILATANGTGSPVDITIPQQYPEDVMVVTVTKQNYFRYAANVNVVSSGLFAQFYADQTTLCSGEEVNFTDISYGNPTSWIWSFPGGEPSSFNGASPPAITYTTPGSYDVSLTVSDGSSNDTQTKTGYISVNSLETDFIASPTTLVYGNSVNFSDITTCNPTSWNWTFPGGTPSTSSAQNPVITYNTAGVYQVSLTASNGNTNDTETKTGFITVNEVPMNYCSSQGNNYSFEWIGQVDFDSFSNPSGASGYSDFTNLEVDMTPGADVNVTLTPVFSSDVYIEYWRIWIDYNRDGDFNDANEEVFAPGASSSAINGSFAVSQSAIGKTRMRVSMKWNDVPTTCESFSYGEVEDYTVNFVSQPPPVADFTASQTLIMAGESVTFNDLSTNNPTSWSWNFMGGTPGTSTEQNPTITYPSTGTYNVKLTASNDAGADSETKFNYITVVSAPNCAGIVSPPDYGSGISIDADLAWSAAENADGYKIYFGTDNPPTNIENGTDLGDVLLNDPGSLDYETAYFWKIVAHNNYGEAQGCDVWSFTTEDEPILPPDCPTATAPPDGATDVPISSIPEWNVAPETNGVIIYFGTDNPPTNIENGTDLGLANNYTPVTDLEYQTTYFWKLLAYNEGGNSTVCETWSFTTEPDPNAPVYFDPVWTSPFNPMSVFVTEALWDDNNLQPGDEIGLFDTDPNTGFEICVGAARLTEILGGGTFLEIIASMDDGTNPDQANGFTPGNELIFKYWSSSAGEKDGILIDFPYQGYAEVYTGQGTTFVELFTTEIIVQQIPLNTGWNMVSFMVEPDNADMMNLMQPLIDQDLFYKAIDENGGSLFHLPFPPPNGQWSNTIGDMACTEGYYLKVFDNCELNTEGIKAGLPMEISLVEGWNIIGYPCADPVDAMSAVQPLIDDGILYKVVNETGGTIFHLPFPPPNGQWSNTIGNFEAGEGYYVKVTENCTVNISEPAKGDLFNGQIVQNQTTHFQPVYQNNPYMPMHIIIDINGKLNPGDEIGVFDGEYCVGAAVIEGDQVIVTCSANDPDTGEMDGFVTGNSFTVVVWDSKNNSFTNPLLICLSGDESFAGLGTAICQIDNLTGISSGGEYVLSAEIYPNPVKDKATFIISLQHSGMLQMEILDLLGNPVSDLGEVFSPTGKQAFDIHTGDLPQGYYLVKYKLENHESTAEGYCKFIVIN